MDENEFWALIDESLKAVGEDAEPKVQAEWLSRALSGRPTPQIESFDIHFWRKMARLYTWELWGVNTMANGHGGQDSFIAFRAWIISRGREAYEGALADADSLAPFIKANIQAEDLTYITRDAYESITGADLYRAANTRSDWFRALNKLFDKYEFLALPTAQVFSFSKETHWPKSINGKAMDTYHRWMEVVIGPTLAGLPTANVPVGFDDRGRAMGMQIFGRFGEDRAVLELASAYEGIVDWLSIRPKLPS